MTPTLTVCLSSAPEQELLVRVRGADVLRFEGNAPAGANPDEFVTDPVDAFVRAANLGMLGGAVPTLANASILDRRVDLDAATQSYHARITGIDPGGFRVLVNMLLARDLEAVELSTTLAHGGAPLKEREISLSPYPPVPDLLPFALEIEPPERSSRDRFLHLVFAIPPSEALQSEVYCALALWTRLLLLGGYPNRGQSPRESGAFPDVAFQLDTYTIEQAFPDLFLCDEASFAAIVGYALRLHISGSFVERIRVG
jgi:hypothetical protein